MAGSVNRRESHPLRTTIEKLEISKAEIARRYGCTTNFIHDCLSGKCPAPRRLEELLRSLIAERTAYLQAVLSQLDGLPSAGRGTYKDATDGGRA